MAASAEDDASIGHLEERDVQPVASNMYAPEADLIAVAPDQASRTLAVNQINWTLRP